jgi:hypothetical protein
MSGIESKKASIRAPKPESATSGLIHDTEVSTNAEVPAGGSPQCN